MHWIPNRYKLVFATSNAYEQAQVDALKELAASNLYWNFNHMFASIPVSDGSKKEDFLNG